MIGVLFGAGASYGAQENGSPPLGGELYAKIKNINIGPRREVKKEAYECLSVVHYLATENTKITEVISIDEWVASIFPNASIYFKKEGFEQGLSILAEKIKTERESKQISKGASFMIPGDDQLDIALPEKNNAFCC